MTVNIHSAARWSRALLVLTFVAVGACSRSDAPCPEGQKRIGSTCRKVSDDDNPSNPNGDANDGGTNGDANGGTDGGANGGGTDGEVDGGTVECAAEQCNGIDDDCDTAVDEACADIDDCASLPCKNGGTCADGAGTFVCTCPPGFSGLTCEENANECAPNPCLNGGTCADGANGFTCTCAPGYQGDLCEIANNDCDPNPCRNGGTCADKAGGGYLCTCAAGYGGMQCETNIDECALSPCMNGGVCKDGVNTSTCTCPAGYSGDRCETNIDECASSPCLNGGTCKDGVNMSTCVCKAGYSGAKCETNVDECSPNPCQNGGTCKDGVNGYMCTCPAGFEGPKCEMNINDCSPNPCMNGGTCTDGPNRYTCTCKTGYQGDRCEINNNDCDPNPCRNGGTCKEGMGVPPTCTCKTGYTGPQCETDINECASNPCVNGTCIDQVGTFMCKCNAGYEGTLCDKNINDCSPNPCQNGGTCTDKVNDVSCTCAAGYSGPRCETNINDCSPNPCLNGGTCSDKIADFDCTCPSGYSGKRCETAPNRTISITLTGDGAAGNAPLVTASTTGTSTPFLSCLRGKSCSGTVPNGTTINLSAKAPGWANFDGFAGAGGCGSNPNCSLTVTGNLQINANFVAKGAIVFVSSTTLSGSSGLTQIEARCKQLADAAGLVTGGPFVTFVSTHGLVDIPWSEKFSEQARSSSRFVLVDGGEVSAAGISALFDGGASETHRAIKVTETGVVLTPDAARVWTGTTMYGTLAPDGDCGVWATPGTLGMVGDPFAQNTNWTDLTTMECTNVARLYCFQDNGASR